MTSHNKIDAARVELLLTELRLPGVKLIWAKLAEQSDKEGWPAARFLAALAEHEIGRSRPPPHRAASCRSTAPSRQDARHLRLRGRADGLESASDGTRIG